MGGQMWNKDDKLEEVKCVIPDRSYAGVYGAIVKNCQEKGQFDWTSTGHVSNVGLMAQKAEEYGSHDKTFEIPAAGTVVVTDDAGNKIFEHAVEEGDIWRMCQTKDLPIQDWVKLAVSRARATGAKAVFWLDAQRAHDANLIQLGTKYLADHDTKGLDIEFLKPADACTLACNRAREGLDTITCTGNVLRDYLTDLFPILELGKRTNNPKSSLLGDTLMSAIGTWLDNNKTPGRKVKQLDNRGSNFYVALYWAQELAAKDAAWAPLAKALADNEETILKDLIDCQGPPCDVGGYYKVDPVKAEAAMRPSKIFNELMDKY